MYLFLSSFFSICSASSKSFATTSIKLYKKMWFIENPSILVILNRTFLMLVCSANKTWALTFRLCFLLLDIRFLIKRRHKDILYIRMFTSVLCNFSNICTLLDCIALDCIALDCNVWLLQRILLFFLVFCALAPHFFGCKSSQKSVQKSHREFQPLRLFLRHLRLQFEESPIFLYRILAIQNITYLHSFIFLYSFTFYMVVFTAEHLKETWWWEKYEKDKYIYLSCRAVYTELGRLLR